MTTFFNNLPGQLFLILIATLPIQLSKHFWPRFSQVLGLRIDYLAPTIFLTDIVILVFILSSSVAIFKNRNFATRRFFLLLGLFLVSFLAAAVFSPDRALSFWSFLKLLEFSAFLAAVASLRFEKIYSKFVKIFAAISLFSVGLGFIQMWQQKSVELWLLGERSFNIASPGIATIAFEGNTVLRPYATFPHPNVLAGFLVISFFIILTSNLKKLVKLSTLTFLAFGILLTFSRTAWLGLGLGLTILAAMNLSWTNLAKIGGFLVVILVFIFAIFPQNLFTTRLLQIGNSDKESFVLRVKLADGAVKMFLDNPLLGVGPGNFIPNLEKYWKPVESFRFFQPVHNVVLLILAEAGVVGMAAVGLFFLASLKNIFRRPTKELSFLVPCWGAVLLISLFDHYFWTLQQGQILFFLLLGLSWRRV